MPAVPTRAAEDVDPRVDLGEQFVAKLLVALEHVLVVELIRPVGVRLGGQLARFLDHARDQVGRDHAALARHDRQIRAEGFHRPQLLLREGIRRDDLEADSP